MKIMYYCYSGAHASVFAAGIHLGLLPEKRLPTRQEVYSLPYFDDRQGYPAGTPFFHGSDRDGHRIYTFAVGNEKFLTPKTVRNFLKLFDIPEQEVLLVGALPFAGTWVKWGGYISLDLGIKVLGRPLLWRGLMHEYPHFVQIVEKVKAGVEH